MYRKFYRALLSPSLLLSVAVLAASLALAEKPGREGEAMPLQIASESTANLGIPSEHRAEGTPAPLWMDVRTIRLSPDGTLDLDQPVPFLRVPAGDEPISWRRFFDANSVGPWATAAQREAQPTGCHVVGPVYDAMAPPPELETASDAVVGKVVGRSHGFHGIVLGTLLKIVPERTYGFRARDRREVYYVFAPVGKFRVGNEYICATDPRYRFPLPQVGDEAVVFAHLPAGENHDFLTGQVVAIRSDGTLVAPEVAHPRETQAEPNVPNTRAKLLFALERRFLR